MRKLFKRFIIFTFSFLSVMSCFTPVAVKLASATNSSNGLRVRKTDDYEMETALSQIPFTIETTFEITSEQVAASGTQVIVGNWGTENATFRLLINDMGKPTIYVHRNNEGAKINGSTTNNNEYYTACNIAYDVRDKGKVHLVVTTNGNGSWWCYINGQAGSITGWRQKIDTAIPVSVKARVGASTNYTASYQDYYFRGILYSLALYSDQRTATEVADTYQNGIDKTDAGLMVAYDFTDSVKGQLSFQDLSSNDNDLVMPTWTWTSTSQYNPDDYAFSFMVVGDTQQLLEYSVLDLEQRKVKEGETYIDKVYDYIADSVNKKKVKHVFGVGDITEYNAYNEWELAQSAMSKLNDKVSYSVIPGNHDTTNWFVTNSGGTGIDKNAEYNPYFKYHLKDGEGNSSVLALSKTQDGSGYTLDTATTIEYYNTFFGARTVNGETYVSEYLQRILDNGGEYYINTTSTGQAKYANTIQYFTGADNLEYMVVALEYGPTKDTLDWAMERINNHPNHNVIITTHGYMWANGTYLVKGDTNYAEQETGKTKPNTGMIPTAGQNGTLAYTGDEMWAYIKENNTSKNVSMILCGHVPSDTISYRQDEGYNTDGSAGNIITQMLIDPSNIDIQKKGQPLYEDDSSTERNLLTGMVATYYVKADGKTIDVEWYSPIQKAYFKESGQFRFTADAVEYPRVVASVRGGNGTVAPTRQELTSMPTVVTFMPDRGYEIKSVFVNGKDVTAQVVDNKLTFTQADGYQDIVVEYEEGAYLLVLENDELKGAVNLSQSANNKYAIDEEITFTIEPKEYYYVHRVRFNGDVIYAVEGTYTINIEDRENTIQVEYRTEDALIYPLTITNDALKGTVSVLESEYEVGTQVSFTVMPIGENTVKEVKFNGRIVGSNSGEYNVTIVATDNIIEIVYNEIVIIPVYSLEFINDKEKGNVVGTIEDEYKAGEQVSFTISVIAENTVKEVRFNGRIVNEVDGSYTVMIASTDNLVEVFYNQIVIIPVYSLEFVNDKEKGNVVGTIEDEYKAGEQVSFTISVIAGNTVKEVRFNGRVVNEVDGTYTVKIASTDNIIQVVYNVSEKGGCSSNLSYTIPYIIVLCGLLIVHKKRKES